MDQMDTAKLRESLKGVHSAAFAWASLCCRGNRELSEDVLQSVYLGILDGKAKFDGKSSFKTWLFAVIRNTARHQQRGRWWSRVVRLEFERLAEISAPPGRVDPAMDDEEVAAVRAALRQLPDRQRQIAHLVFYEGLSIAEAAEVTGVSVGTARQHYARAKDTLKARLKYLDTERPQIDERSVR